MAFISKGVSFRGFSLIGIAFVILALSPIGSAQAAESDLKYEKEAAEAINEFAFDMYRQLIKSTDENIFFGSHSISSALAMTYAGASGEDAKRMAKVMRFGPNIHKGMGLLDRSIESSNGKDGCQVWVANAVWPAKKPDVKMTDTFEKIIKNDYKSDIQMLDYRQDTEGSRRTINKWVEGKTNDRIRDLVPLGGVRKSTTMVLTSATYFKGEWERPFKKKNTQEAPFHFTGRDGKQKKENVKLMAMKASCLYEASKEAQMLAMPYKDPRYCMVFILPSKEISFSKYERALGQGKSMEQLRRMMDDKSKSREEVIVYIPKFKTEKAYSLMNHLRALGLRGIEFRKMLESRKTGEVISYAIEAVIHKSFIELDEEKTEAAAATAVIMEMTMAPRAERPPIPIFRADRPFIYLLADRETGAILYMGRFVKPE